MDGMNGCGPQMLATAPNEIRPEPAPAIACGTRPVLIKKVANGFVLEIGCCIFVAKTWVEASTALAEYWVDPVAAEKKYRAA